MTINTKATNITLTTDVTNYLNKQLEGLSKFIDPKSEEVKTQVELARTTKHHEKGDIFRAEITIYSGKQTYRAESETTDLYSAIDDMKEQIVSELRNDKKRKLHFLRKGGQRVKDFIRGFYGRK